MTGVWDFYNEHWSDDRSRLSERERAVLAICDLRQEVASGGFDSYFRFGAAGDWAPEALQALPTALGHEWAVVLSEAMATLGDEYPTDLSAREVVLANDDLDDSLEALDHRLYALEASVDADARLLNFLKAP